MSGRIDIITRRIAFLTKVLVDNNNINNALKQNIDGQLAALVAELEQREGDTERAVERLAEMPLEEMRTHLINKLSPAGVAIVLQPNS